MGVQNMLQFNSLVILVSWPSHHPIFDCLQYAGMEEEGLEIAIEQVVEIKHFHDESRCTSCIVQVETEEDSLRQAAFNQLEKK